MRLYGEDLAYIHDVGFGDFARRASAGLLELLGGDERRGEVLTDLGCGSGIWARRAVDAGWRVVGIDLSAAMIALASDRVPEAELRVGSLFDEALPVCSAVTAIGECLGYADDPAEPSDRLVRLFRRIHAALEPQGVLVFDLAEPGRGWQGHPHRVELSDWAIEVSTEEDPGCRLLTRRITTWRHLGGGRRREHHEVHYLRLYPPEEVLEALARVGLGGRTIDRYGELKLPDHLIGYVARKGEA